MRIRKFIACPNIGETEIGYRNPRSPPSGGSTTLDFSVGGAHLVVAVALWVMAVALLVMAVHGAI